MVVTTLGYLEENDKVLMLHRVSKKEDINAGKWIGIGGKMEPDESVLACMQRECFEETGLVWKNPRLAGIITFCFRKEKDDPLFCELMFLYCGGSFSGDLKECSEGKLAWIDKKDIPSLSLWKGDRIFLKQMFEQKDLFYMVLDYLGDELTGASIDGTPLDLSDSSLYL
jgi:8-oxo-dGTP diphosphatase